MAFRAAVEHGDDGADDLQVADLFGGNVHQQVLAARIAFTESLGEVTHCSRQFALGPPNCSSMRLASCGLDSRTRTVYISFLW
jgi:hypothetical protein